MPREMLISSAKIVGALETVWKVIQERHPEVPDAVLIVSSAGKNVKKLGHFHAQQWHPATTPDLQHEVWISGQRLAVAENVLETLIHEAAHALNCARNIKDTDHSGRVHNAKYKAAAEELGLQVMPRDKTYGFAFTDLTDATKAAYMVQIGLLKVALAGWHVPEQPHPQAQRLLKAKCSCGRIIRASREVFDGGCPVCPLCDEEFVPVE